MELGTPQAVLLLTVTVVLLPVALMAALKNRLSLSSICTKLAAIILTPICWSSPSQRSLGARGAWPLPLCHRNVHHGRHLDGLL